MQATCSLIVNASVTCHAGDGAHPESLTVIAENMTTMDLDWTTMDM